MCKLLLICCLFVVSKISLEAGCESLAKARCAAFIPSSKKFRNIYGNCAASYQCEGIVPLNADYQVWLNLEYLQKKHKKGKSYHTSIKLGNIGFGILQEYYSCIGKVYLGAGALIGKLALDNHCYCEHEKFNRCAFGAIFKSGILYDFRQCFYLDFFTDYYYELVKLRNYNNVGGLKTGLGIVIEF